MDAIILDCCRYFFGQEICELNVAQEMNVALQYECQGSVGKLGNGCRHFELVSNVVLYKIVMMVVFPNLYAPYLER